jgi:hypothetical protein
VQGSAITNRALQGAYKTGHPLEAIGSVAQPERLGVVLALVVGELTRTWTKQRRKREATPTTPVNAGFQPTSEESTWKP